MTGLAERPGKVKSFLRLVAIEHSVFALPFAYLSALVAMDRDGTGVHWVDLLLTEGPVDHLDHASYQQFWGGKAGLDATRKLPTEGYTRGWPQEMTMAPEVAALVDKRWKEYGIS